MGISLQVSSILFPNKHAAPVLLKVYFFKRPLKCSFVNSSVFKFCLQIQTLYRSNITYPGPKKVQRAEVCNFCFELEGTAVTHTLIFLSSRNWRTHTPLMHMEPYVFLYAPPCALHPGDLLTPGGFR